LTGLVCGGEKGPLYTVADELRRWDYSVPQYIEAARHLQVYTLYITPGNDPVR
jgi:hypothetical protein